MILDAFGAEAGPLLVAGALGGLARGLLVLRKAAASGPITGPIATTILIDMGTSIVLGSLVSLFLHDVALAIFGAGLDVIHVDPNTKATTSGFIAGLISVAVLGFILDTMNKRAELKAGSGTPPQ